MSVIIPGVELPENCLECWFIRKDNVWIGEATYEYIYRCLIRQTRYDDEDDEDDEDVWFSFKEATKCRHECCPLRTHLDLPTRPLLVKRMNLKKQTTTAGDSVSISYAHGEADFSDLVHVVRCKDCTYLLLDSHFKRPYTAHFLCTAMCRYMPTNGYCSYGKKR